MSGICSAHKGYVPGCVTCEALRGVYGAPAAVPGSPLTDEQRRALTESDAPLSWRDRARTMEVPRRGAGLRSDAMAARAREAYRKGSAATDALDAIAKLCGVSEWDYPGQVVRDVETLRDERDHFQQAQDKSWGAADEAVAAEHERALARLRSVALKAQQKLDAERMVHRRTMVDLERAEREQEVLANRLAIRSGEAGRLWAQLGKLVARLERGLAADRRHGAPTSATESEAEEGLPEAKAALVKEKEANDDTVQAGWCGGCIRLKEAVGWENEAKRLRALLATTPDGKRVEELVTALEPIVRALDERPHEGLIIGQASPMAKIARAALGRKQP